MSKKLVLVSHHLCPYVQRAVIALTEKGVDFDRVYVDLANKPDWFLAISPLGKTPVLRVGDEPIFESAIILEYLEETQPRPLHPAGPLKRAQHRSWIEFGSAILNDIWAFYSAPTDQAFTMKIEAMSDKFSRVEGALVGEPYFDGEAFSLVDAAFGPIFRYFDVFDQIDDFGVLANMPKVQAWRRSLAERSSIKDAVGPDYAVRLAGFLAARRSYLSTMLVKAA